MTVQEIFNSTAVRSIEEQILSLYHETERNHWYNDENKKAIRNFLEVRKKILNSMFVLDEQNKQLLIEFNEVMKQQLIDMRKRQTYLLLQWMSFIRSMNGWKSFLMNLC